MGKKKKPRRSEEHDPRWRSPLRPAPGNLRVVQDFVNTAARDRHPEEWVSPRALADWLLRWALIDGAVELGAPELARAIEVRSDLRSLIAAWPTAPVAEGAVARLERTASAASLVVRFESVGGVARLEPAGTGFDGALAKLLEIVATTQASGLWQRFGLCSRTACRAAFYDFSARRNGRWCNPGCGNRVAVAAYRRRQPKRQRP